MLVEHWTGRDPLKMTFVKFNGILQRVRKLRWYEVGGGMTQDEVLAERMQQNARSADDI